jgi:hypothetical protein
MPLSPLYVGTTIPDAGLAPFSQPGNFFPMSLPLPEPAWRYLDWNRNERTATHWEI